MASSPYLSQGDPYAQAANPNAWAGSGAVSDPIGGGTANYPAAPDMGTDMQAGQGDKSYMNFTEQSATVVTPAGDKIDPDTGIGPTRLSDCVCVPIFCFYIIGMIIVVCVAKQSANTSRLTRGYDYYGRLCGVDEEVADKPYLFWCRADATEAPGTTPASLNLQEAICVSYCPNPTTSPAQLECLLQETYRPEGFAPAAGGMFDIVESNFVHVQQSIVMTNPYPTVLFSGRYCMPEDQGLRATVMNDFTGPVNLPTRWIKSFGSFKNCWGVLFGATLISSVVSLLYILAVKVFPKWVLLICLLAVWIVISLAGIYFFTAVLTLIPQNVFDLTPYIDGNPIYDRMMPNEAAICCTILGLFLLSLGFSFAIKANHVPEDVIKIHDLLNCAYKAVFSMKELFLPPIFEALWKFVLTMILFHNFMYLCSTGWIDDRRIVVNGVQIQGASKKYCFSWWWFPWILYYIFGAIWCLEIANALGQFVQLHAMTSYYFTPKVVQGPDGLLEKDTSTIKNPALTGIFQGIRYHLGSLIYGASVMWWFRTPRLLDYTFLGELPDKSDNQRTSCFGKCINNFMSCLTCCLGPLHQYFKTAANESNIGDWTRIAYMDVIYRSTHWEQAKTRSRKVLNVHPETKNYMGAGHIITFVGVITAGVAGAFFSYECFSSMETFTNPTSGWFIQDPIACTVLAFFLCMNVGYSFIMIIDNAMDALLWLYAVNKKVNKATCEKYMPNELKYVVGTQHENKDGYPLYGSGVPTQMYAGPAMAWMFGSKKAAAPAATAASQAAVSNQSQQPVPSQSGYAGYPPQGTYDPTYAAQAQGSAYGR